MKILLSGGTKTNNIVNGISKKFESSNDQFMVVEFLDNINDVYSKGDYYDKAVITEQSITREYTINDEYEIRARINKFALECSQRAGKQSYVFLTKDEVMANIIYEEILPIERNSVVVLAKPPYSVVFFHTIIINDVNQLPSDITFKPKAIQNEFVESEQTTDDEFNVEVENTVDTVDIQVDDLFKDDVDNTDLNNANISNDLNIGSDEGFEFEGDLEEEFEGGFEGNFEGGFEGDFEGGFEGDFTGNNFGGNALDENFGTDSFEGDSSGDTQGFSGETDFNGEFNGESYDTYEFDNEQSDFASNSGISLDKTNDNSGISLDKTNDNSGITLEKNTNDFVIDDITPIKTSGDLPDYINHQNSGITLDKVEESIPSVIPGFDNEPDMQESSFSNNLYGDFVPDDKDFDNDMYDPEPEEISQQLNESNITMSDNLTGFDDEDYTEDNNDIPNNNPMAFRDEDYDGQINPAAMAAGAMAGMGVMANELNQQADMMNQQVQNQQVTNKKKGWLNKNKQPQQPQNQVYANEQPVNVNAPIPNGGIGKVNVNNLKSRLKPSASKGESIVFTGCGGCGTSILAYSTANVLNQLGYNVLLVDFDTEGRAQSYMTRAAYDSMDPESSNLMSAVNSSTGISNYTSIVKEGFHLLTMGLGSNTAPVNELIHKEKLSRFVNVIKTQYNFIIYDIPFQSAVGFLSEIVYMANNTVLVTDASNWGITKTMINMCNIASDEMQDTMFNRAQFVFNKYRRLHKVFGKKVKTCNDITKIMDEKVYELIGDDIGLHFDSMKISGIINDTPEMEDGWFADVQYSDTAKGQQVFLKLIESIILE